MDYYFGVGKRFAQKNPRAKINKALEIIKIELINIRFSSWERLELGTNKQTLRENTSKCERITFL